MADLMDVSMDVSSHNPRGTKRKADDERFIATQAPKRIKVW